VDSEFLQAHSVRPEEEEAIWLVWEKRGHSRTEAISAADANSILAEIREREDAYERRVLASLKRATGESRRYPRRHMVFSLLIVFPIAIILIVLIIVVFGGFRFR
jgi:hypothetical protein